MEPTFSPGDVVIDKPQTGAPAAGDVVTFKSSGPDAVITHRVQDVNGTEVYTKGDANRTPDAAPISVAAIVGRTVRVVPHLGYLVVYLRQPAGAASVVTLLTMLMFAWGLFFGEEATSDPTRVE
jgi:signal peptidase